MKLPHTFSKLLALALLALAVLAGCAPEPVANPAPIAQTPAGLPYPAPATAVPEAQPAYPAPASAQPAPAYPAPQEPKRSPADPLPEGVALRLSRSGGIAGISETWIVYTDGRVEVRRKADAAAQPAGQVDPAAVQAVLAELDRLGFYDLQAEYSAKDACCDLITATLQARSGGREHRVILLQEAEDTPAEALAALQAVQALLDGVK